jgi:molecular chaperone DnaK (HSP70)
VAEVGREYEIGDRAPLSLGIEVEGGMMKKVIEKDTPVPCHRFYD